MKARELLGTEVVAVEESLALSEAHSRMAAAGIHHLPVVRGRELVGIFTERDLLFHRAEQPDDASATVGSVMTAPVRTAKPDDELAELGRRMLLERIGCLPIVDAEGGLLGIVTRSDVIAAHSLSSVPENPSARELMTRRPATALQKEPLGVAAERMSRLGVRHLPVVDAAGTLVGMLSDRDVRSRLGRASPPGSLEEEVGVVMSAPALSVAEETPASTVARLLLRHGIGAVPVVDPSRRLVGIISYVDLLRRQAERR